MATKYKYIIGTLLLILLASGVIYVTFESKVRIRVDNDKSTFYVKNDNNRWVVSGREINSLFEGTSKKQRDVSEITITQEIGDNHVKITRTTPYKVGPTIIDTYYFDGTVNDVELFPINHTVEVLNGQGFIYQYEVRNLVYDGPTIKNPKSPLEFGRNMKVEWDDQSYWSTVYKSGILKVRFRPDSDYEIYNVRLFDPVPVVSNLFMNSTYGDNKTSRNITAYWNITDDDGDDVKNITTWYLNGSTTMAVNMPFENNGSSGGSGDYSGNENNGTEISGPIWNGSGGYDGKGAYQFDGVTNYIKITGSSTLELSRGNDPVNIAWMMWTKSNLEEQPANTAVMGASTLDNLVLLGRNNDYICLIKNNTGDQIFTTFTNDLFKDEWKHHACVINGTHLIHYIDGVEWAKISYDGSIGPTGVGTNWLIGFEGSGDRSFNGSVDELMVFNYSLTPQQVLNYYENNSFLLDSSQTSNGDNWSVCITPNDNNSDGTEVCDSNGLIVTTCGCPGTPENWEVDATEYCTLNSACNISGYNITYTGTGNHTINSNLYLDTFTNVSSSIIIWLQSLASIFVGVLT